MVLARKNRRNGSFFMTKNSYCEICGEKIGVRILFWKGKNRWVCQRCYDKLSESKQEKEFRNTGKIHNTKTMWSHHIKQLDIYDEYNIDNPLKEHNYLTSPWQEKD